MSEKYLSLCLYCVTVLIFCFSRLTVTDSSGITRGSLDDVTLMIVKRRLEFYSGLFLVLSLFVGYGGALGVRLSRIICGCDNNLGLDLKNNKRKNTKNTPVSWRG